MDLSFEKQNILQLFDQIEAQVDSYKIQIENLKQENEKLNQSEQLTDPSQTTQQLVAEIELLKYKNNELETLLTATKSRIGELSNVLIDKENQLKELKLNQQKRKLNFDIGESDQLFEAKMAINEKDKQIRRLYAEIEKYQNTTEEKDKIAQLEAENDRLNLENKRLNDQLSVSSPTIALNEIDSLLDEIADIELSDDKFDSKSRLVDVEAEFEFTDKAKLALNLLSNGGLYRDQFKKELLAKREIIGSFIAEVNGQFEDEYYFELIVEDKNYFTINPELFE